MAKRTRQLRVQENADESEVAGPSTAGKYAGSFKLRFLGFGSTIHKSGRSRHDELQHVKPAAHNPAGKQQVTTLF